MTNKGTERSICAIVLASGKASRMGELKQLLEYKGMPLMEHAIRAALNAPVSSLYAVVGHRAEEIMDKIKIADSRFQWLVNEKYEEGQSEALKCAINAAKHDDGVIVFLADQPLIHRHTIERLYLEAIEQLTATSGRKIVVQPSYEGIPGHPVFFSKELFPRFRELNGDEGGKRIFAYTDVRCIIPVNDPGVVMDVDTPADYRQLLQEGGI